MKHRRSTVPVLALLTLTASAHLASGHEVTPRDWPNWRGPQHDGSCAETGLPQKFGRAESVAWSLEMPGPGASTPVIIGDRVFLTAADEASGGLLALCVDRNTGEVRWDHDASTRYKPGDAGTPIRLHDRSNYASPSAVTDGERVVFFFGNGDLVCYDLEGEEVWRRNLQEDFGDFTFQWTFSASPTLYEGLLVLPILQRDQPVNGRGKEGNPSFLLGIDPATGKDVYRSERPSEAQKESLESYATAIPYEANGRKELLVIGGDVITGHEPGTGKELWRWGTWNEGHREIWWRLVPSAVVGGGVALVCAPKRAPVYAVKLGGAGDLDAGALAWKSSGRPNPVSSDVPTPLYYRDSFFVLSDVRESLSRVDPASGDVEWTVKMPGKHKWRASPTGADGRIWCMNHAGLVVTVDPDDGEVLHSAQMGAPDGDFMRSSISVAHGQVFVRTNTRLFCLAVADQD